MDYACPAWRSAARTHVRRLQVLQSKCLRLATGAPWYVSNRQIHEDLCVSLFADHIRVLTASFDSKLADVGNPLVRQLGRYLRWPRVGPVAWRESEGRQGPAMAKSTKRIAFGAYQPSAFRIPWLSFSVILLCCKVNDRMYERKSGHGPHSPQPLGRRVHLSACKMSLLRLSQSGLRTQTANQAKFIPPTIRVVPPRR